VLFWHIVCSHYHPFPVPSSLEGRRLRHGVCRRFGPER
jgi:hypothetical protein